MSEQVSEEASVRGGTPTIVGGAVLLIICCAGPVLLAGGAVSSLGAAVHNPWLIVGGGLLTVLVSVFVLLRHRGNRRPGDCCPPSISLDATAAARASGPAGSPSHASPQLPTNGRDAADAAAARLGHSRAPVEQPRASVPFRSR